MVVMPGIEDIFEQAYNDFSDAIFRHCAFRLRNRERGMDLMQETYLRLWNFMSEGKEIEHMRAFLYRIANNLVIDDVRKKKEQSLDALQEAGWDIGHDETGHMQDRLALRQIMETLGDLDPQAREVIVMRFIDGLTPADIGEILGESPNTISVRLHRATEKLKGKIHQTPKISSSETDSGHILTPSPSSP